MKAEQNFDRCRTAIAAWGKGDIPTVRDMMADDIVWHWGGKNQLTGDSHGPDDVLAAMGKGFMLTGGTLKVEEDDILASETRMAVFLKFSGERDGTSVSFRVANALKVDENGKWTESWFAPSDREAFDELLA